MQQKLTIRKKNVTLTSDDIRVDRKAITKVIMTNINNPAIIEINLSMYVIPNNQREMEEYQEQIDRIAKASQRLLRCYVSDNSDLFDKRSILDINFTSANLKKGYNKSVQMSLFVRQKYPKNLSKIKNSIKETIKPVINTITSKILEEDFKCYKKKQVSNNKLIF